MATLRAESKSIQKVFADEYVIPEFQRKYSWDTNHCERLWRDLIDFYKDHPRPGDGSYFLGNIVLFPGEGADKNQYVIDGQQRLITLSLLIKALFKKSSENTALEECLWKKNPLKSGELLRDELRVQTCMIGDDALHFEDVINIIGQIPNPKQSGFHENMHWFEKNILDSLPAASGDFSNFVLFLLQRVELLPIECESQDQALGIFQTINDRGLQLDDSDIFKSQLYGFCEADADKKEFVRRWNQLNDPMSLFRAYMYVLRAQAGEKTRLKKALRAYFNTDMFGSVGGCDRVMSDVERIAAAEEWASDNNVWWKVMQTYPNVDWKYPLFVFMFNYGRVDDGIYSMNSDKEHDFRRLLEATVQYFFIKGVVHNNVGVVRETVVSVCRAIDKEGKFLDCYRNDIASEERDIFHNRIKEPVSSRYVKGLVVAGALLREDQSEEAMNEFLSLNRWDIEHILPNKWRSHYYGDWDESKSKSALDKLGNLMPLEKKINISASNLFFAEKKKRYGEQKSRIGDARFLAESGPERWTVADFNKRHEEILARLNRFFSFAD